MATTHPSRQRLHYASESRHNSAARAANRGMLDVLFVAAYIALGFLAMVQLLQVAELASTANMIAAVFSPVFGLVESFGVSGTGVLACVLAAALLFVVHQVLNGLLRLLAGKPGRD